MIPAHKQRQLDRKQYFSGREHLLKLICAIQQQKKEACPHCQSMHIIRHGKYRDRQRYKCQDCGRTFNDLTNTPLHRTKYPQKWLQFLECMIYGYSLRRTAVRVGISWVTAFYWRHKMIKALQAVESNNHMDRFWPRKLPSFICVKQNPPLYAVYPDERQNFKMWIQSFDWIAQKYLKRYISWFRLIEKTQSLVGMENRLHQLMLISSSIPMEQTYQNVRTAS